MTELTRPDRAEPEQVDPERTRTESGRGRTRRWDSDHPHYRWVALSNTTIGMLMATVNASIMLISLPAIFRGIGLNPLAPQNVGYLLWMIMGYLLVSAVLVVALGRLGDSLGRVRIAGLLSSMGRGGLQFMLIIWLQGIWLPLHGYTFESTPLWAGIYLLPLTIGFVASGPLSGYLSDRHGARLFAGGGLLLTAATFLGLLMIPVDFGYPAFAVLTFLNGVGSGMFASPNTAAVMNSVPAEQRGAAAGMRGTFFNAGSSLSIGVFFSLMVVGLANTLPSTLSSGLRAHGVPAAVAAQIGQLPPVGSLFAAFLGYNPVASLLQPTGVLEKLPAADSSALTGTTFFPTLISGPFHDGLIVVFVAAAIMMLIGAVASFMTGPGRPEPVR